jgi:hypothetical protein
MSDGTAAGHGLTTHRAPTTCPVCSSSLITLRLGCPSCGTELSGHFDSCRYCRLDSGDAQILEVFLRSRGNVRDVQAFLGVSYPTARARLGEMLERLGFGDEPAATPTPTAAAPWSRTSRQPDRIAEVLADLAAGRMDVDEAERLLGSD